MVPDRESFSHKPFVYAGPEIKDSDMSEVFLFYLTVSIMMISYIMMMILGRLLTMKMMAIIIRTIDNLCSLALNFDPINQNLCVKPKLK